MRFFKPQYAIIIVVLTAVFIDLSLKNWEKQDRVIEHDVHSYYSYLPEVFIYDDLKIEKSDYRFGDNYYFFWQKPDKNGNRVAKMTCGLSIMYAPFFFTAHFITKYTSYQRNGFSEPYKIFLLLSSIFYLILGLDFVIKILKNFAFSDKNIFISILFLGLGTNLLAYSSQSAVYSHVYSFALFAGFIYNTIKWHYNPSYKRVIWLGLLFGLIALVRPSNALIILFFILCGIEKRSDFKTQLLLYKENLLKLLIIIPLVLFVWFPQLIYWKLVSGDWFYYSYREEGFYFLDPQIINGLFSFRKGWLLYTPIMTFALIGLFFLKSKIKKVKWAIIIFFLVNIYVVFSWWCWWYGGTFGQRVMVESYALLIIPLTAFVTWINTRKIIFKIIFYTISAFFIWLNIFQTYQFENKSLHYDSMSKELYFKQFGKYEKIKDFDKYLSENIIHERKVIEDKQTVQDPKEDFQIVNIKAPNGMYLCTEWDRFIMADKQKANTWENFKLLKKGENLFKILSYDNRYLSVEDGNIVAKHQEKEKGLEFYIEYLTNTSIIIKTEEDLFLSCNTITSKIILDSTQPSVFVIEKNN